jgi:hypothetical protein
VAAPKGLSLQVFAVTLGAGEGRPAHAAKSRKVRRYFSTIPNTGTLMTHTAVKARLGKHA